MPLDGESTPVIVAASGGLGYEVVKHVTCSHRVEGIMTDYASKDISEFAEKNKIPLFRGNPRNGKAQAFLSKLQRKVLLSVNYLFLFDEDFLQGIDIAFNVHGSLLPKYRGRTPHVWAIINNERECGITAHRISAACDTGNILVQKKVRILKTDTGSSILEKYVKMYPDVIRQVFDLIAENKTDGRRQNEKVATYFGKRTPEDGRINWWWQRERIYNWIRAQTRPYPGAFSFIGTTKIICWKSRLSSRGFSSSVPDGTILHSAADSLVVKTPNGCLEIEEYQTIPPDVKVPEGGMLQ